jgi:hypothetical protein
VKRKGMMEQSVREGKDEQSKVVNEVIKIGSNDVVMGDCFKGPIIINGPAQDQGCSSSKQANDHEASSSKSDPKYHQPRW